MGRMSHISAGPMAQLRNRGLQPAFSNGENRTVKRTIGFVAGIAVLGIALYVGSRLFAQGTAPPRPTSKIAVVNMQQVIEKYEKFVNYKNELERFIKFYQEKETVIKGDALKAQEKAKANPIASRDTIEQEMEGYKRKLEDLGKEFKKELAKKQQAELVTLYREIEDMVKRVAIANSFEMVLQYNELIDPKDAYNPALISQKVHPGVCMPMYAAPGLDISAQVIKNLNFYYGKSMTGKTGG
jgi:Skp family chaperone for outer membrane proteins